MPWTISSELDNIPKFAIAPLWDRMLAAGPKGMGHAFDAKQNDGKYPSQAHQTNKVRLGHFIMGESGANGDTTIVSGRVREAIEKLEPSVHQFLPIDILMKSGAKPKERYFNLRYGQSVMAILSKRSGFDGKWRKDWEGRPIGGLPAHARPLYFSEPAIHDKHLWLNPSIHGPLSIVISDNLKTVLDGIGIEHLYCQQHPTVSEEWDPEFEIGPILDSIAKKQGALNDFEKKIFQKYRGM